MKSPRLLFVAALVVLATVARLIPHPFNFTPVGAAALLAGAAIRPKWLACLVPVSAMLFSDAVIGFHSMVPVVYGCFVATVGIGFMLRRRTRSPLAVLAGATSSATLFFIVTNFWVWSAAAMYPHSFAGLTECYVAAIPFYGNQLAGDAVYATLLFGGVAFAERRLPVLAAA